MTPRELRKYKDKLVWEAVFVYQQVDNYVIKDCLCYCNIMYLSLYQDLDDWFILRYGDILYWELICRSRKLSPWILHIYKDVIRWDLVSRYEEYTVSDLLPFSANVDWDAYNETHNN
ncbi:MAG: hypothetical protein ACRDD8_10515 [Bacteroidales bacterium]